MSFEHLLTASFRDVTFLLEDVEGSAGRRAAAHEYPKKETSFAEDNGAAINKQSINARVVGDDYLTQLSALLGVLNQSGPGELVHPWWGIQQVQIGSVTHKFALNTENTATVSFECFEAAPRYFQVKWLTRPKLWMTKPNLPVRKMRRILKPNLMWPQRPQAWVTWSIRCLMIWMSLPVHCRHCPLGWANGKTDWHALKAPWVNCWPIQANWRARSWGL
ncbi:DNA circularization N-terminal domain-containing protein [Moritella viscosa]